MRMLRWERGLRDKVGGGDSLRGESASGKAYSLFARTEVMHCVGQARAINPSTLGVLSW